jgi:hypothetical protein
MDASELASKMLQAETLRKQLVALENEITTAVLELKGTQKVGHVKVTYTQGRRELDWMIPASTAPKEVIEHYTVQTAVTDWKKACELAGVDEVVINASTEIISTVDYAGICKKLKLEPVVLKEGTPSAKISYS